MGAERAGGAPAGGALSVAGGACPFPEEPFPAPFPLLGCGAAAAAATAAAGAGTCSTGGLSSGTLLVLGTNVVEGARPANSAAPLRGSARPEAVLLSHRDRRFFFGSSSPVVLVVSAVEAGAATTSSSRGRFVGTGWGFGFAAAGFLAARGRNMGGPRHSRAQCLIHPTQCRQERRGGGRAEQRVSRRLQVVCTPRGSDDLRPVSSPSSSVRVLTASVDADVRSSAAVCPSNSTERVQAFRRRPRSESVHVRVRQRWCRHCAAGGVSRSG